MAKIDPKSQPSFVNLYAARTGKSDGVAAKTGTFQSLLGNSSDSYAKSSEKAPITKDIAQPSTPAMSRFWRKS